MPLAFDQGVVRFDGHCLVEEAMTLLEFFQAAPEAHVDLAACKSMHASLLQVLAAVRPRTVRPPSDRPLACLIDRIIGDTA